MYLKPDRIAIGNVAWGDFLEQFLSYRCFLVGTWIKFEKLVGLSRSSSVHRVECIQPGMKGAVVPSVSLAQACPLHHAIDPIPPSHHKLPQESALHAFVFLFCWTSSAKSLQSAQPAANRQSCTLLLQLVPSASVLCEYGHYKGLSLCSKTYLFFIYVCFKRGGKSLCWKNTYFNIQWEFLGK